MPIQIGWFLEDRISYFLYTGNITLQELTPATKIGLEFLENSDAQLIHTIQDSTHMKSFPLQIAGLLGVVRQSLSHPKMGWFVSQGIENKAIQFVASMVTNITRTRHRIFTDLSETTQFLNYVDTTLPDLSQMQVPSEPDMLYYIENGNVTRNPHK